MLGNREDARDSTQEILLEVTTHLGSFRGESTFSIWVYWVAKNHLLSTLTRARKTPAVSFETMSKTLKAGIELGRASWENRSIGPEETIEAREMAITCTHGMLMRLDREHRLINLLDAVFGLASEEGAQVLEIQPPAYRKRLSRAGRWRNSQAQPAAWPFRPPHAAAINRWLH